MINLGDTGLIVQYIQNFLKDNYNKNIHLSDEYDRDTHQALIEYLQLPEILDCYSLKDLILSTYTFKEINPPNLLIDGGGIWNFDFDITPDTIRFYNRPIQKCFSGAVRFIHDYIDRLDTFCRNNGWYVAHYSTFSNNTNSDTKAEIVIQKEDRKQLLPCKDIINMINISTNNYLINKCFLDDNNAYHGFINYSQNFKIAIIPAKPGDTFTIAHGYKYACELAIGYTEYDLTDLTQNSNVVTVDNIVSYMSKSPNGELNAGEYSVYRIPINSECKYLLVQMPFVNTLIDNTKTTTVLLGDIDQDGEITINEDNNESDYSVLKRYVEAIKQGNPPPFKLTGPGLIAANLNKDLDINGNQIINETDLKIFEAKLIEHKNTGVPVYFGETTYTKKIDLNESNFDKLLVMYGDIEEGNTNNVLNIPISEFQDTPWLIHDEFLPYILGSAIHKYSDIEDILWLQNKVREFNSEYTAFRDGYYDSPEDYVLNEFITWNENKMLFEYYKNGVYTGYVLDNIDDITNGRLVNESTSSLSSIQIVNGHWLINNEWSGAIVLSNGRIVTGISKNSLKEIIKSYQIGFNDYYKNQNSESIKFINGYVTPLTEKWLTSI